MSLALAIDIFVMRIESRDINPSCVSAGCGGVVGVLSVFVGERILRFRSRCALNGAALGIGAGGSMALCGGAAVLK